MTRRVVLRQNGCNFVLHKSPGNTGANEWTACTGWAVDFARRGGSVALSHLLLLADRVTGTGEAKLVRGNRGALDEVRVLQSLCQNHAPTKDSVRSRVRQSLTQDSPLQMVQRSGAGDVICDWELAGEVADEEGGDVVGEEWT